MILVGSRPVALPRLLVPKTIPKRRFHLGAVHQRKVCLLAATPTAAAAAARGSRGCIGRGGRIGNLNLKKELIGLRRTWDAEPSSVAMACSSVGSYY